MGRGTGLRSGWVAAAAVVAAVSPVGRAVAAPPDPVVGHTIDVAAAGNSQRDAAVAFNGDVYLVVWEEWFADGRPTAVFGVRVSNGGAVIGTPFRISAPDEFDARLDPAVASDGHDFMVVYRHDREQTYGDLDAAIVGGDGSLVRDEWAFRWVDNDQFDPVVAWNGHRYLVVWEDGPDPTDPDVFGARAFADGRSFDGCSFEKCVEPEIDDPGIAIRSTEGQEPISTQRRPAVTATPGTFHITWQDDEASGEFDIRSNRLRNGRVLDASPGDVTSAAGEQIDPAMAANGHAVLTAWTDGRSDGTADIVARLGASEVVVAAGPGDQYGATVTTRGDGFLLAWTDTRSGNADVYAGRVNGAGVVRDGNGIAIAATGASESEPSLAAGRNNRQLLVHTESTGDASRIVVTLID